MPGNIPLSYETHIGLVTDIVRGASYSGFNKFIILSAHGQVSSTIVAVHKLGLEGFFTLNLLQANDVRIYSPIYFAQSGQYFHIGPRRFIRRERNALEPENIVAQYCGLFHL